MEAKKGPVIRFVPITSPDTSPKKDTSELDRFLETLITQGFIELRVPDKLRGKLNSLYLVKRQAVNNPNAPKPPLPQRGQYTHLPVGANYDAALNLTLAGVDTSGKPVAIGYRDYKLFEVSGTANGDMGINKKVFPPISNLPPMIEESVSLSDQNWPGIGITNGIEISTDYQSSGLGRMLTATAALLLGRQKIKSIELGGDKADISDQVMKIYQALMGAGNPNKSVLDLNHLNLSKAQEMIKQFLLAV